MCGMRLDIIILVLTPLKFPLTIRNFIRIHSYNNFIFETVTYCSLSPYCCCSSASSSATFSRMCFNHFQRHPVFSFTLLYNKEAVSFKLWSPSATVSRVHVKSAKRAWYKLLSLLLIQLVMFIIHFQTSSQHGHTNRKQVGWISFIHGFVAHCFASMSSAESLWRLYFDHLSRDWRWQWFYTIP